MAVNDPLNTNDPPVNDPPNPQPQPQPNVTDGNITCQGCGCRLARNGDVLSTGERYQKFLKHDQEMERKNDEIARLNGEIAKQRDEISALKGSGGSARAEHRPGGRVEKR